MIRSLLNGYSSKQTALEEEIFRFDEPRMAVIDAPLHRVDQGLFGSAFFSSALAAGLAGTNFNAMPLMQ